MIRIALPFLVWGQLMAPRAALSAEAGSGASRPLVEIHANLDIDSLDPAWANDNLSRTVILNIYEPLVSLKGDSLTELKPQLSVEVPSRANGLLSPDGLVYKFPIRESVYFHDGARLSCEDTRYSILRFALLDRPNGGPSFHLLKALAGVLRTRDETGKVQVDFQDISRRVACEGNSLRIVLRRPYSPLLHVLAQFGVVVNKNWAMRRGDWDGREETWRKLGDPKKEDSPFFGSANGTGPYFLEAWEKAEKSVRLKRNARYWRRPAEIESVVLKEVPDQTVRRMMLGAGDADVSEELSPQYETQWKEIAGATTLRLAAPRTDAFFFTFSIDPAASQGLFSGRLDGDGIPPDFFSDKDARQAFAYAFDQKAFLEEALGGRGLPPSGVIPSELLAGNGETARYERDLGKARAHFQKAWKGMLWQRGFRLAVFYNAGNPAREAACQILKAGVESINPKFHIEVRALNWASYLAGMRQKKLPVYLLGYAATFADPDDFASAFLHSQGLYLRLQGFKVPSWDTLVENASYQSEPDARTALYRRLVREAFEEVPQLYIAHPLTLRVVRDWIAAPAVNPILPGIYFYDLARRPFIAASAAGGL